jgi:hypothetical protein|tara:strand:- start:3890 stop:4303 length:414 start_codon:yes stop_codon:yes gene_type:complete
MAIKITPQESTAKWVQRTQAASGDYVSGINRVTEAPGILAARQSDAYMQGVQNAMNKWKRNVAAVTLDQWKDQAINVGAGRIAAGVNAAQEKTLRATERNFANIDSALSGLPPRGTFEQNIQRMTQFVTKLHQESNK